ncbi:J domain-containing protein [Lichenifustis flavocetrariae]|uniref:J domain-containing protein n=1 Tax=Lichenifustis flavocetrariae TaxID=2949735 RepID=A0AA41YUR2_9HYPH|nr:J domain-containing protein [Lichenifustis flavocetrariae]MCW6508499.1 J domain-containing protein [Lichenifustis flavocetrariae]
MNLNSRLFDGIRASSSKKKVAPAKEPTHPPCAHPGCPKPGNHRAPMGRDREGQFFCFCVDHVREYNATYNYFDGMSDEAVAKYQKEALVGHRPTWDMGVKNGSGTREAGAAPRGGEDALGLHRQRFHRGVPASAQPPRYSAATMKSLYALELDDTATTEIVKVRYKELVKRHHPDANGGDRSSEERLREIIRAYNYLKTVKLADGPAAAPAARRKT